MMIKWYSPSVEKMMHILVLLVFIAGCSAVNRTVVFGNAYYYGHYLHTNLRTSTNVTFQNPPITDNHRWIIDWDTIFVSNGSITWKGDPTLTSVIAVHTPTTEIKDVAMGPGSATNVWKLKYRTSGSTTLYMIESLTTPPGCLQDETLTAKLAGAANCTESNPKAWWHIYLA